MPYEKTASRLENFIGEALRNTEIQEGAKQAELKEESLVSSLKEKASEIWDAAASEIEAYDQLENDRKAKLAELRKAQQTAGGRERSPERLIWLGLGGAIVVLVGILMIILGSTAQATSPGGGAVLILFGALFTVGSVVILFLVSIPGRASTRGDGHPPDTTRSLESEITALDERLKTAEQLESEITALDERLKTAEQAIETAVIEKGIIPELRSIINAHLPSYDTNLAVSEAPGLAEVFNPAYEITTESKGKLRRLLTNMPGGSIGIAGPRGVGKTTLLWALCSKASTTELKDRPVLSVMTSAPVEYDAREFILHIFSSICQRALELKGRPLRRPWDYMNEIQEPPTTFLQKVMGLREVLASILLGLLLMISGYLLIAYLPSFSNLSSFFFGLGLLSVMLGLVGGLLVRAENRRRRMQLKMRRANERDQDELVAEAYRWLREIKFQQSYSSGWAGSLKGTVTPIAVEAKAEAAMSFAQNQLSLPEIMDHYRDFLELASKEYEAIIGIDELDKIGSDEHAQRFLNEIKALFGMENCFYLISVSENALSSFERRGLPVRDVFDSSFDDIVHVDYLDLDRAQSLLRRRVIGVPIPFLDFCHCMAGGLPRDLIRTFRNLFEARNQADSSENDLSTLCSSLIRSDLKSKLRATSIAAKDAMLEPEVNQLFERIRKLEPLLESTDSFSGSRPALLESYRDLLASLSQKSERQAEPAEVAAKREKLTSLSTELAVYIYYSVTLLEFFGQENFSEEDLKAAESSGALDRLARARQFFAISPSIAESVITDFRKSYNMDIPQGASAPLVHTARE